MEVKDAFLPVTRSWYCRQAGQRLLTMRGVVGKELARSAQALATYPGQSASGLVTRVGIDMSVCLNLDPPPRSAPTMLPQHWMLHNWGQRMFQRSRKI